MKSSMARRVARPRVAAALIIAAWLLPAQAALGSGTHARQFESPEEAVQALVGAVKAHDQRALRGILGPEARSILSSGDPVADRAGGERFVESYEEGHSMVKGDNDQMLLQTGKDDWPFPIPLVKSDGGWHFDTAAGEQEILDRRIGTNELAAIQACLAYVDAQREYYSRDPDHDGLLQYAQRFTSTPGKRDGLYWATKPDEEASPLGPLFARARSEGYAMKGGPKPPPYHGYYYRILTAQGPDAAGGAYSYLARGQMFGGFALVAYPAQYGNSGVMTFIVNHDGVVFQKDLGPKTASVARAMKVFDPDATWKSVEPESSPQAG